MNAAYVGALFISLAYVETDGAMTEGRLDNPQTGNERILVVDDDDLVRSFVGRQLISLGYRVVTVADGPAALEAVRSAPNGFDLLFTDMVMPGGMSGKQLADEVVRLCPGLPVLFTSGYADWSEDHAERIEKVHLLQKPYRRQDLAAKVRMVIDRGSS